MKKHIRFLFPAVMILVLAAALSPLCAAETESGDSPGLAPGAQLRIMSYNILHPDWSRIPVTGRADIVADILRCYMPDVAALQEAGAKWHKALRPLLTDNGLYAPACRQSNAEGFIFCTTTFLYNPRTVRLVEEYVLDLDLHSAARVFSVAVFERLQDGARFVVANTHPAPREDMEDYLRNMADLTVLTAETVKKYAGLPVILTGDFNTPEQSEHYLSLMDLSGIRDAKYAADVLERSCSTYFGYQVSPDTNNTDLCIDHIFVNDRVDVRLFTVIIGHDAQNASDHLPILADICLK